MKRLVLLPVSVLLGLSFQPSHATGTTASSTSGTPTEHYTPGLGEFMSAIQLRHAKLWFAGTGNNWPLAAYELDELKEAFNDVEKYQPVFHNKPVAKLIVALTTQPIAQLEQAIKDKNAAHFTAEYDDLSQACSACHQANDHGFIVIQRPTAPPLTNQRYQIDRLP